MAGALRRWPDAARTGLVRATGQLGRPLLPRLPGLERLQGPAFHSANWDAEVELAGKRVAVIGTGASAIQFVPRIAPQVQRLSLFQRSAPYVIAKPDRTYADWERRLKARWPWLQRLDRGSSTCTTNRGCSPSRPSRR